MTAELMMLKECFVIQCFDRGIYDQRFRETFAPAIKDGGAVPVRSDETLGTKPVIEKIEAALRRTTIAFGEISEDNPNVFFELGYALALGVPTVIVCERTKREKLPFDIQHRPIIFYAESAESDFQKLKEDISKNVEVALSEAVEKKDLGKTPAGKSAAGMDEIKRLCLLQLLESDMRSPMGSTPWELQKNLPSDRINDRMLALALTSLQSDYLIEALEQPDGDGGQYNTFRLTDQGRQLLLREYAALMDEEQKRLAPRRPQPAAFDTDLDDDVPF